MTTFTEKASMLVIEFGYPVFPCRPNGVTDVINGKEYGPKSPYTAHGFHDATVDLEVIRQWGTRWPDALVGVPTGKISGIDVIDLDRVIDPQTGEVVKDGVESLKLLHLPVPPTRMHKTTRGAHILFKSGGLANTANVIGPGIDTRGEGGYIIWWPAEGNAVEDAPLAYLPDWVIPAISRVKPKPKMTNTTGGVGIKIIEGGRNDALFKMASMLQAKGLSDTALYAALAAENAERCVPPLSDAEVVKIAESVTGRYEKGDPPTGEMPGFAPVIAPDDLDISVIRPIPNMSVDVWHSVVRDAALAVAKQTGVDPLMVAWAMDTIAGGVANRMTVLKVTTTWSVGPQSFVMVIGDPSTGKGPATAPSVGLIQKLEKERWQNYLVERDRFEAAQALTIETETAKAKKALTNRDIEAIKVSTMEDEPTPPAMLMIRDSTTAGIVDRLCESTDGLLAYKPDAGEWITKVLDGRGYEASSDWIALYDRTTMNKRLSKGQSNPHDPVVSLLADIQPEVFQGIKTTLSVNGTAARIIPVQATHSKRFVSTRHPDTDDSAIAEWERMVRRIHVCSTRGYRLSDEAHGLLDEARRGYEVSAQLARDANETPMYREALGKMDGHLMRCAIRQHLQTDPHCTTISADTAARAVAICQYIEESIEYHYGNGSDQIAIMVEKMKEALLRHDKDSIALADIKRGPLKRQLEKVHVQNVKYVVTEVMDILADSGWVVLLDDNVARRSMIWAINPELKARFPKHVKAAKEAIVENEKKRKERAAKNIAARSA